jgi:hypothetical protein
MISQNAIFRATMVSSALPSRLALRDYGITATNAIESHLSSQGGYQRMMWSDVLSILYIGSNGLQKLSILNERLAGHALYRFYRYPGIYDQFTIFSISSSYVNGV